MASGLFGRQGVFRQENAPLFAALASGVLSGPSLAQGLGQGLRTAAPLLQQRTERQRQLAAAQGLLSDPNIAGNLSPQARAAIAQNPALANNIAQTVIGQQLRATAPLTAAQRANLGLRQQEFELRRTTAQREAERQAQSQRLIMDALGIQPAQPTQQPFQAVPSGTTGDVGAAALGLTQEGREAPTVDIMPTAAELEAAGVEAPLTPATVASDPQVRERAATATGIPPDIDPTLRTVAAAQAVAGDTAGAARTVAAARRNSRRLANLTPGQKRVDQAFSQEVIDFDARGGFADVQGNIRQLRDVRRRLRAAVGVTPEGRRVRPSGEDLTGGLMAQIPDRFQALFAPERLEVRDAVEEVVQRNLRLVLGAQFTEREGQRLIERSFNPLLSERENIRRLDRLIRKIEGAAQQKVRAINFFKRNGTLVGFQGNLPSPSDFGIDRPTPPATGASI